MDKQDIPKRQEFLWPMLSVIKNLGSGSIDKIDQETKKAIGISDDEEKEYKNLGKDIGYEFRWTRTSLKGIGAIENPKRKIWSITEHGKNISESDLKNELTLWRNSQKGNDSNVSLGSNFWIFQANPKKFAIGQYLEENLGKSVTWDAKQQQDLMNIGNIVYFWTSGEGGGLTGIGHIEKKPSKKDSPDVEEKNRSIPQVAVIVDNYFTESQTRLNRKMFSKNKFLKDSLLMRNPQGTNFLLKSKEAFEIQKLLLKTNAIKIWLIPGNEECIENGMISIEYNKIRELSQYKTKEEIAESLSQSYPEAQNSQSQDVITCYNFSQVMKPGDLVIIKYGMSKILSIGHIVSNYQFRENDPHRHSRDVAFSEIGPWQCDFDALMANKTAQQLSASQLILVDPNTHETWLDQIIKCMENQDIEYSKKEKMLPNMDLNLILYGPPGTGKTYIAKSKIALQLLKNQSESQEDDLLSDQLVQKNKETTPNSKQRPNWENFMRIITFHQSFSYEEFVEGIRPVLSLEGGVEYKIVDGIFKELARLAANDLDHNYLLIIDEINRGNIAKIFGELITLLEPDKRSGQENSIEVILPYSKERFSVPSNLFILGTMNTADRSIALLDIALRRRFNFKEVMPDYDVLASQQVVQIDGVDLVLLLKSINEKISVMIDQDHQIGHSYFMNIVDVKELRKLWYSKIIPLLQEYFYNDWDQLEIVIKGFVKTMPRGKLEKIFGSNSSYVDAIIGSIENFEDDIEFCNMLSSLYNLNAQTSS